MKRAHTEANERAFSRAIDVLEDARRYIIFSRKVLKTGGIWMQPPDVQDAIGLLNEATDRVCGIGLPPAIHPADSKVSQ